MNWLPDDISLLEVLGLVWIFTLAAYAFIRLWEYVTRKKD